MTDQQWADTMRAKQQKATAARLIAELPPAQQAPFERIRGVLDLVLHRGEQLRPSDLETAYNALGAIAGLMKAEIEGTERFNAVMDMLREKYPVKAT